MRAEQRIGSRVEIRFIRDPGECELIIQTIDLNKHTHHKQLKNSKQAPYERSNSKSHHTNEDFKETKTNIIIKRSEQKYTFIQTITLVHQIKGKLANFNTVIKLENQTSTIE
jgi:hypothetical protein